MARAQHGMVTHAQALEAGFKKTTWHRLVRRRGWARPQDGVYVIFPGDPYRQRLMAALLWAGPDAVFSMRTAARLLGLQFNQALEKDDSVIDLLLPHQTRRSGRGVTIRRTTWLPDEDRTWVDGFPVTTVGRTLMELGKVLCEEDIAVALESAWFQWDGMLDQLDLKLGLRSTRGRTGVRVLRKKLRGCRKRGVCMESPAEVRFWERLVPYGLPEPTLQKKWKDADARGRIDFTFPDQRVAIEVVGRKFHGIQAGEHVFETDSLRYSRLAAQGSTVLHVTCLMMEDFPSVVDLLVRTLRAAGGAKPVPASWDRRLTRALAARVRPATAPPSRAAPARRRSIRTRARTSA